jgi:flagellar protein FlaG
MASVQLGALLATVSSAATTAATPSAGAVTPRTNQQDLAAPSAPPAAAVQPAPAPDAAREALEQATQRIRDVLKSSSATLVFTIDEDSGHPLLRIFDSETKQLIRQIPSEEVVAISRALDRLQGLLLQQKA